MSNEIQKMEEAPTVKAPQMPTMSEEAFNQLVQSGDISRLDQTERSVFVYRFAERLGLNPLTKPIDLIVLNGKLTLYANRTATDQLAKIHNLSLEVVSRERDDANGTYIVTVKVKWPDGREDENIGAVGISDLSGEALANAMMKAYTKAKRRAVLSTTGLGFLDELEIDSIRGASEEALAHRGVSNTAPVKPPSTPSVVVTVPAPESEEPQMPQASPTPGKPKPPVKPPQ
jgi:hypothetical protein